MHIYIMVHVIRLNSYAYFLYRFNRGALFYICLIVVHTYIYMVHV